LTLQRQQTNLLAPQGNNSFHALGSTALGSSDDRRFPYKTGRQKRGKFGGVVRVSRFLYLSEESDCSFGPVMNAKLLPPTPEDSSIARERPITAGKTLI